MVDVGALLQRQCSPRSMYSLATTVGLPAVSWSVVLIGQKLGIEDIKECALKDIKSKLTTTNVVQELFTSFAAR